MGRIAKHPGLKLKGSGGFYQPDLSPFTYLIELRVDCDEVNTSEPERKVVVAETLPVEVLG